MNCLPLSIISAIFPFSLPSSYTQTHTCSHTRVHTHTGPSLLSAVPSGYILAFEDVELGTSMKTSCDACLSVFGLSYSI